MPTAAGQAPAFRPPRTTKQRPSTCNLPSRLCFFNLLAASLTQPEPFGRDDGKASSEESPQPTEEASAGAAGAGVGH